MIEEDKAQLRRRPVFRVFVSSTFTDLKHERDALQRDVFPKLEQLCASRQFQFQAIDLRWGVPTEASLDHRTMQICFEELRRSQEISPQPNFLILLGNRYGWRPLPEEVSEDEFRRLEQAASSTMAGKILGAWYRRDENAVPPVHVLQSRKQNLNDRRDYTNDQVWNEVQGVLWDVINHAYPPDQLAGRFDNPAALDMPLPAIVRFQASATEQEIWRGALGVPNASQHVLAFVREIENIEEFQRPVEIRDFVDVDESGAIDAVSQDALRKLKEQLRTRLGDGNVIGIEHARLTRSTNEKGEPSIDVTARHLEELCARVQAAFEAIVHRQINEYWGTPGADIPSARELELERLEHRRFGQERAPADSFVGRERHLQAIKSYLLNDSRAPLVIHGASGCGKTALLARAAQDVAPEWRPVVRFIGVTPRSSDIRSLLASLCRELRQRHPLDDPLPSDVHELTRELQKHFKAAAAHEPLILFLDALDQLTDADNGRSLFWIPFAPLPSHYVKLIVSSLSDRAPENPAGQPYAALTRRGLAEEDFINLDALSEAEAQTLLFERWFPQAKRTLNHEQAQRVRERLTSDACRLPLYVKVLFEEARLWRSYDPAPPLDGDVPELLRALFNRLGDPANHGATVECALGYIASARRGLTEMEILEVLYRDPDYKKFLDNITAQTGHKLSDNPQRIPIAIWSRLRFDLAPYLAENAAPGGTVLNFYHRQVGEYVRGRFLDTPLKRQTRHERLAEYFQGQDYFLESLEAQRQRALTSPPTPRPVNVRKIVELPWQRIEAAKINQRWEDIEALFTDLLFLEAMTEGTLVFELIEELAVAIRTIPLRRPLHSILDILLQTLQQEVHWLQRHPETLLSILWNICWWHEKTASSQLQDKSVHRWRLSDLLSWWWRRAMHSDPKNGVSGKSTQLDGAREGWKVRHTINRMLECWLARKLDMFPSYSWVRSLRPPRIAPSGGLRTVLEGHTKPVCAIAAFPGGRRIASGSEDGTVRVWDAFSGRELLCFRNGDDAVWAVDVSRDGTRIVTGSFGVIPHERGLGTPGVGGTVQLWDADSGTEIRCLRGHSGRCTSVALSSDGRRIVSGSSDRNPRIWDAESGLQLTKLEGHTDSAGGVAYAPGGLRIATVSYDKTLRLWDAQTGTELRKTTSEEQLAEVAYSPDGRVIIDDWGTLRDASSLRKLSSLGFVAAGRLRASSLAFSPDGRSIATAHSDGTLRVWDARVGRELLCIHAHDGSVRCAVFLSHSNIATAGEDRTVRVWDTEKLSPGHLAPEHSSTVTELVARPGRCAVASSSSDGTILLSNALSGEVVRRLSDYACWFHCLAFSPNAERLAVGTQRAMRVWTLRSEAAAAPIEIEHGAYGITFMGDARRVACYGHRDASASIWDVESRAKICSLVGHKADISSISYVPGTDCVATSSQDGTIRLWSSSDGRELQRLVKRRPYLPRSLARLIVTHHRNSTDALGRLSSAPNGRLVAAPSIWERDRRIHVWDVESGAEVQCLVTGAEDTMGTAISVDGCRLAAVTRMPDYSEVSWRQKRETASTVIWDLATGQVVQRWVGETDPRAAAASAEEFPFLALSDPVSRETMIFDRKNARVIALFPAYLGGLIAFQGGRIWAGSFENHVYIIALEGETPQSTGDITGDK